MNAVPLIVMTGILVVISVVLAVARKLLVDYGDCKIVINGEKTYTVKGGDTLLSYFIANKIFIPSACGGKATCGFCKTKVLTDVGDLLPTEAVFISKEEEAEGVRLACQVKVKKDLEISFPEYLLGTREYKTRVHDIRPPDDPLSMVNPKNVPKTCGKCHPGANPNFAVGKIHVDAKKKESGIIFWTATFFKWLTIGTMLALIAHIFLDMYGRTRRLRGER